MLNEWVFSASKIQRVSTTSRFTYMLGIHRRLRGWLGQSLEREGRMLVHTTI